MVNGSFRTLLSSPPSRPAYTEHPAPLVRKPPEPPTIPETSWINHPDQPECSTGYRWEKAWPRRRASPKTCFMAILPSACSVWKTLVWPYEHSLFHFGTGRRTERDREPASADGLSPERIVCNIRSVSPVSLEGRRQSS